MPNRLLLAAAERPGIRDFITKRRMTRAVADRFVAGERLEDAIEATRILNGRGIGGILDYLGENVTSAAQADAAMGAYLDSLEAIAKHGVDAHISVKLTQLGLDIDIGQALERMEKICARAGEISTTVAIDMESHEYTDRTIETFLSLRSLHPNVVICLQAYLRRTEADVARLLPVDPAVRLCKGAYNEPREIVLGARATRRNYINLLASLVTGASYTAIATHDGRLIEAARRICHEKKVPAQQFEFQMLYGVRRDLQDALVAQGYRCRVYIPFGDQWYPYLTRRLAERPANLRLFVEALIRR